MATGKRLPTLEMPDDEPHAAAEAAPPPAEGQRRPQLAAEPEPPVRRTRTSIPLPPIPPARKRELMVQLSIKAPHKLVERLERMNLETGAQKQAILAAALEAYLEGHGF